MSLESDTAREETPLITYVWKMTQREGVKPLLVASVWNSGRGGPLPCCVRRKKTQRRRGHPLLVGGIVSGRAKNIAGVQGTPTLRVPPLLYVAVVAHSVAVSMRGCTRGFDQI